MQLFLTARTTRPALASVIALGALATLLLSGCGGGGGINGTSTSNQGYRIVPAGGMVIPLTVTDSSGVIHSLVTFATQPGVVNSGVEVSAVSGTAPANSFPVVSTPANTVPVPGGVYQITVNPDNPTINVPIILTLAYTGIPKDANQKSSTVVPLDPKTTFRIYYLPPGGTQAQWIALPNNTVSPASSGTSGTVTATIATVPAGVNPQSLPGFLKSGTYAIFATAPPANPFPQPNSLAVKR